MLTSLATPSKNDLVDLNKTTRDGDGTILNQSKLDDIVFMRNTAFDYAIQDANDPIQLGMAFAWCLVNEHVFFDGNKTTARLALDFILTRNNHALTVPTSDQAIIDIVDDLHQRDLSAVMTAVQNVSAFVL